jgi:hypothetical protein
MLQNVVCGFYRLVEIISISISCFISSSSSFVTPARPAPQLNAGFTGELMCAEVIPVTPTIIEPEPPSSPSSLDEDEHLYHPDELLQSYGLLLDHRETLQWMYERVQMYQPNPDYLFKANITPSQKRAYVLSWLQHVNCLQNSPS